MEGLITAIVDMFPRQFHKKGARETLVAVMCITGYLIGLTMCTNVSKPYNIRGFKGAGRAGGRGDGGANCGMFFSSKIVMDENFTIALTPSIILTVVLL